MDVLTVVKILGKVLQLGLSGSEAWTDAGLGLKEVATVPAMTELAGELGEVKKDRRPDLDAQLLAVVTRSFGQAIKRHWAFNPSLAPSSSWLGRFMNKEKEKRETEIEQRLKLALDSLEELGKPGNMPAGKREWKHVESLTGSPLSTPYYQALWKAFTDSKLDDPEDSGPPLIDLSSGGGRLEFERHFLLAYHQVLSSAEGQPLQEYQVRLSSDYLGRLLRELLLRDMATWDKRHIFGNSERRRWTNEAGIPFLPLGELYVEPDAHLSGSPPETREPVLGLIERLLNEPGKNILVIKADFGMGKSLTARTLAQRWAHRFPNASNPSSELIEPVFIRCAEDLTGESFKFEDTVRRAWKRQADALELDVKVSNPALAPPGKRQRAVFLIDGLDEVVLDERRLSHFFKRLREESTSQHRFIVLSRPGALPSEKELEGIPVIDLQQWQVKQIDTWLDRWRQVNAGQGPTLQELEQRRLSELAATPILLFMIAQTWSRGRDMGTGLATLYEEFFWQIAKGKHDNAREHHPRIYAASSKLCNHLIDKKRLAPSAEPPEAMLWLMSRIAWEATKREQHGKYFGGGEAAELTGREIENLIESELGLQKAPDTLEAIQVSLLLTMQAHLSAGRASRLLFGHKSFREYLAARYWADRLKAIVRARVQERVELEKPLLDGRLLSREDRTFEFLMEMLNGQPLRQHPRAPFGLEERERKDLLDWAQERFESEEQRFLPDRPKTLREDRMPWLREAALAIGSRLRESEGLEIKDSLTVRAMLAWFWLMRIGPIIIAPNARWRGALLSELSLWGADFRGADLTDVHFTGSDLMHRRGGDYEPCDFTGATLDGANMFGAMCTGAQFTKASLKRANLDQADLEGADFEGASLIGAYLRSANMFHASLIEADLSQADLEGASLSDANLKKATLHGTDLLMANLNQASLQGASFSAARLDHASLRGALLHGADLRSASLDGADLKGARYTRATQWPKGSTRAARGAVLKE